MVNKVNEILAKEFENVGDHYAAKQARDGYYGDFTSPLVAPQCELYAYARKNGFHDIAQGVLEGRFTR